jgi:hypothetical protein
LRGSFFCPRLLVDRVSPLGADREDHNYVADVVFVVAAAVVSSVVPGTQTAGIGRQSSRNPSRLRAKLRRSSARLLLGYQADIAPLGICRISPKLLQFGPRFDLCEL